MERLPHGRHTAGLSRQAVARARSRKRRIRTSRRTCLVVLGAGVALVAAGFTIGNSSGGGNSKQGAVLTANSSNAPLIGTSVGSTSILTRDTSEFGHLGIYRVYYTGLPAANAWTGGLPGANKSAVIVSFKALPDTILSGADDTVLKHFFDTAPTGHPIYYVYYHEPEDNIAAGQFTAPAYRAAWAHVVALADQAHNPALHSTLTLMAYDLRPASHRNWRDYLPSGGIISTLAWDAYPQPGATHLQSPEQFMAPEVAASKAAGMPFGFAEFGVTDVSGRPGWLTQVGNYLMKSGALFGTLFDSTPPGAPDLTITDSASEAAWRGIVTESDIANGIDSPAPGPAPSTPPPSTPPTPVPTPTSSSPPSSNSPEVSGLAMSPASVTPSGENHTVITFSLSQASDVTVLVLNQSGVVVRTISKPAHSAGKLTIPYYGYNGSGHPEPAGSYQVLIVASNANGSGTAEAPLVITGS